MSEPRTPLGKAISHRISSEPRLTPIATTGRFGPHTKKMTRHISVTGRGLAHEYNLLSVQHLWVRADQVATATLADIAHAQYEPMPGHRNPGRHSNVEAIPGFKGSRLIRYTPATLAEAERIIAAVVGDVA